MITAILTPVDQLTAAFTAGEAVPRLTDFSGAILTGFDGTAFFLFV